MLCHRGWAVRVHFACYRSMLSVRLVSFPAACRAHGGARPGRAHAARRVLRAGIPFQVRQVPAPLLLQRLLQTAKGRPLSCCDIYVVTHGCLCQLRGGRARFVALMVFVLHKAAMKVVACSAHCRHTAIGPCTLLPVVKLTCKGQCWVRGVCRLLYYSGSWYPIMGALRMSYGGRWQARPAPVFGHAVRSVPLCTVV